MAEKALPGPRATLAHDAGAIAQCSYCRRFSLDPKTLSDRQPACDCGRRHGWSGSFKSPGTDAKWSGPSPAATEAIAQPAGPDFLHTAEDRKGIVARTRRIATAVGMATALPEDDASVYGALFTCLGMMAGKIERLAATSAPAQPVAEVRALPELPEPAIRQADFGDGGWNECLNLESAKRDGYATQVAFNADQMNEHARPLVAKIGALTKELAALKAAQGEPSTDQLLELAANLERVRAVAIVKAVSSLEIGGASADMPTPFQAGYQTACDEISHRVRTEAWGVLPNGGFGPTGAANEDDRPSPELAGLLRAILAAPQPAAQVPAFTAADVRTLTGHAQFCDTGLFIFLVGLAGRIATAIGDEQSAAQCRASVARVKGPATMTQDEGLAAADRAAQRVLDGIEPSRPAHAGDDLEQLP